MTQATAGSASRSGTALVTFLQAELAPTPGRGRATLRIVVATLVAPLLIAGLQLPEGHWILITLLSVSLPDAGASLVRGFHRLLGTLAGATAAIAAVIIGAASAAGPRIG